VELGQVAVEDTTSYGKTRAFIRADAPSWVMSTAMPSTAQSTGDGTGQPALVFGDQDSHFVPG
jgi:hypothetical protein